MSHDHAPYRDDEPDRLPGESRTAYKRRTENHPRVTQAESTSAPMGSVDDPLPPMAPYGQIARKPLRGPLPSQVDRSKRKSLRVPQR